MDRAELEDFVKAVFDRFRNPFIIHQLSSIALNSISKFKVRVLPSLLEYVKRKNSLPMHMVFAFACLIRFYKGSYNEQALPVNDDVEIIKEMAIIWQSPNYETIATKVLSKVEYWGEDLTQINGLKDRISIALRCIDEEGIKVGFTTFNIK